MFFQLFSKFTLRASKLMLIERDYTISIQMYIVQSDKDKYNK